MTLKDELGSISGKIRLEMLLCKVRLRFVDRLHFFGMVEISQDLDGKYRLRSSAKL